jgi:hypothetical protein
MPENGAKDMNNGSAETADATPLKRKASAQKKPFARSRVGNGKALLSGIDQRSLAYREYQDTVADLVSHMGGEPTDVQQAIIEEAAGLIVWQRSERVKLLTGDGLRLEDYCKATNSLLRLLTAIGQKRRARDITPDVDAYLTNGGAA